MRVRHSDDVELPFAGPLQTIAAGWKNGCIDEWMSWYIQTMWSPADPLSNACSPCANANAESNP
jgi:hypothetical protein